ncbi:hypothetical protein STCU_11769 [Strigomonas culicis]|uniref:Uncharacterized protein n=1 Tax=Strigomonas culicis TaxID=28005 RepID=S9THH0_9TRYP|nr:hypothetical protein STCU_11769 [Strigomonas culicis]|eukprot:EPY15783.1 hypothetical protein STCU_11769 [Strigomonas culicis]
MSDEDARGRGTAVVEGRRGGVHLGNRLGQVAEREGTPRLAETTAAPHTDVRAGGVLPPSERAAASTAVLPRSEQGGDGEPCRQRAPHI